MGHVQDVQDNDDDDLQDPVTLHTSDWCRAHRRLLHHNKTHTSGRHRARPSLNNNKCFFFVFNKIILILILSFVFITIMREYMIQLQLTLTLYEDDAVQICLHF